MLIAKGARVNARNDDGITPLHLAAYPEMARMLVANGAELEAWDFGGRTPLHVAVEHLEHTDVVEELLELSANVNAVDDSGRIPLDVAETREDDDKIELLKHNGARNGSVR